MLILAIFVINLTLNVIPSNARDVATLKYKGGKNNQTMLFTAHGRVMKNIIRKDNPRFYSKDREAYMAEVKEQ